MAKMFYTVEEVCSKLEKNEDEVRELVRSGQIQEFRDRDKLMFKVEQIDLLASGDEDTSDLNLELEGSGGSTGMPAPDDSSIGLADSRVGLGDSRVGLADSQEPTVRRKGRTGLESLEAIRRDALLEGHVPEDEIPEIETVDAKLVALATRMSVMRTVTNSS